MTEPKELTCREMVELMTEYLEGAMSPQDRARFEEHLSICEGCTNYIGQLRTTIRATGMLSEESIPDEAREELLAAFRDWRRG